MRGSSQAAWLVRSLGVTTSAIVFLEVLKYFDLLPLPAAGAIYLTAVVFSTYFGGTPGGLVSTGLGLLHSLYMLSTPGHLGAYTIEDEVRLGLQVVTSAAVMAMVNMLLTRGRYWMRELTKSEARAESIIDSVPDAIVTFDSDGIIETVNQSTEDIFGYAASELVGKEIRFLLEESDQVVWTGYRGEVTGVRSGGETVPLDVTITEMKEEGYPRFIAVARDISERKRDQEALKRLGHQHELILNSAGEGIYGLDAHGLATFVNPAGARMVGYEVEELLGKNLHSLVHHRRSDGSTYPLDRCPLYACLRDGQVRQGTDEVYWRRDGTSFEVEYTSTPIWEDGEIVGAVVVFKDITERRVVERMKDEFIAVVSHELRTPLTSIRGALGLLSSGLFGKLPEDAKEMMDIALRNTERLTRLINDILDIKRMESGKETLVRQVCDAGQLVHLAAAEMASAAEAEGITLKVQPLEGQVWADPDQIIQTLTNLLGNAIKFSDPGSVVYLGGEQQGEELVISVKDHGRGIPEDKLELIFERFAQVDASDRRMKDGTGLGLAICRSIVQRHGGRIWAESVLGEGSTFRFTLPMVRDNAGQTSSSEQRGKERDGTANSAD